MRRMKPRLIRPATQLQTLSIDHQAALILRSKRTALTRKILADGKIWTSYNPNLDSDTTTVINRGYLAEHYVDNGASNNGNFVPHQIRQQHTDFNQGNSLGLYNLTAPTDASHAVNLGYLEDNQAVAR